MPGARNSDPLQWNFPIVDPKTGFATPEFLRQFNQQRRLNSETGGIADVEIVAGVALSGGGRIGDLANIELDLEDTAVTPGSYTNVDLTVDQQGRITAAANGAVATVEWTLHPDSWEHAVSGNIAASLVFDNIDATEILVEIYQVTKSVSGGFDVQVSVDNGATFFTTSGEYITLGTSGTPSNHVGLLPAQAAATAARTNVCHILNAKGANKMSACSTNPPNAMFVASASDIDAIRVIGNGGNFTGGAIRVYTR